MLLHPTLKRRFTHSPNIFAHLIWLFFSLLFFVPELVHHSFIQHFSLFVLIFPVLCLFSIRYIRLLATWSIIQCVFCSIFRNSILYFQSLVVCTLHTHTNSTFNVSHFLYRIRFSSLSCFRKKDCVWVFHNNHHSMAMATINMNFHLFRSLSLSSNTGKLYVFATQFCYVFLHFWPNEN